MYPYFLNHRSGLMHLFLSLMLSLALSGLSFAQEPANATNTFNGTDSAYHLSIENHRITLKVEKGSLKSILETIGQQIDIDVVARIHEEKKITIQFEAQPLEAALKLFNVNYAMVTDSENNGGNIRRIIVVPEGQQVRIAMTTFGNSDEQNRKGFNKEVGSKNEPFMFKFDPPKVIKKQKVIAD